MSSRQHATADHLLSGQVQLHRAGVPTVVLASMAVGLALVLGGWSTIGPGRLLPWVAVALLIGVANLGLRRAHRLQTGPDRHDAIWRRRYLVATGLRGLGWGLCSVMLWPAEQADVQWLIALAVVIACAITLAMLAFDRLAAWAFALPALVPLMVRLALAGDPQAQALATMVGVMGVAMSLLATHAHRQALDDAARRESMAERHAALQRSEHQLNEAEQLAALGSFDWHLSSGTLHWSDQHHRLWGLAPGQVTPTHELFLGGVHADDVERLTQTLDQALRGERPYECQYRVVWPDGTMRDILGRGQVHFDGQGRAERLVGTVQDITERLRVEEFRRTVTFAMDALTDPVSVVDQDEIYRFVNTAWCRSNLRRPDQAIGQSVSQIFPLVRSPDRRAAIRNAIDRAEHAVVRSTGPGTGSVGKLIETRYLPFRDPNLAWHGALMISRDITESASNEAALALSLDNLRLTLNATGDAIFASDAHEPQQRVLFANEQLLQLWNIPAELADQVTPVVIIDHARPLFVDPDREVARIAEIIASGEPAEDRLTLNDGRVLVRRCIPTLAAGRQVRVWGFRDVTAEAQALQGLRDSEARLRVLLDAFPGYISALNASMVYRYANARVAALFDLQPGDLIGQPAESIVGEERSRQMRADIQRAIAGERVVTERHVPAVPDRPARVLLNTLAIGTGSDGEPLVYAFGTDITDLKKTEDALLAAKEDAERANRAKSQFLSNMSHELRTPMNAVLGFGQLLEMNPTRNLNERQLKQVQEILRAGQHLLALINDLLDLARIESGHVAVSMEAVSLPELIEECLGLMQTLAERHDVRLLPPSSEALLAPVMADRMRLKQVLLNLLANAIKYNREEGQVTIRCIEVATSQIRIEVNDTGQGLDPLEQARLFTAFERLNADKTVTEGTGIGLALSRRLVHLMNGEIGLSSQVGVGSCFWVQLHRAPDSLAPRPHRTHTRSGWTQLSSGHSRELQGTVLCVDDNPVNLSLLTALLEDRPGLKVLGTTEARRALAMAAELKPDLVLLDIQLPELDGLEVLRRLRADHDTAAIPVIAVSADAMPDVVRRCMDAGFADYVTKPVDATKLLAAVDRELLRSRRPLD